MKLKFAGSFLDLKLAVAGLGIRGKWIAHGGFKQFRADNRAILNFWPSNGTVSFQGPAPVAKELEAAFRAATTGPCSMVIVTDPKVTEAVINALRAASCLNAAARPKT